MILHVYIEVPVSQLQPGMVIAYDGAALLVDEVRRHLTGWDVLVRPVGSPDGKRRRRITWGLDYATVWTEPSAESARKLVDALEGGVLRDTMTRSAVLGAWAVEGSAAEQASTEVGGSDAGDDQ